MAAFFALLLMCLPPTPRETPEPPLKAAPVEDFSGWYWARGTDPCGMEYEGVVRMDRPAAGYRYTSTVGMTFCVGLGVPKGDTLAVGWIVLGSPGTVGVTHYRRTGNGFDGVYLSPPGERQGHETLTLAKK